MLRIEIEPTDQGGYMYEIYINNKETSEDGGLCTGSAFDALVMATAQAHAALSRLPFDETRAWSEEERKLSTNN